MTTRTRKSAKSARRALAVMLTTMALIAGSLMLAPGANAATIRPGAGWGQVDVLLDSYETEQARRSFWAATVICWQTGLPGIITSIGACQSLVTVCAAQAYYSSPRKRAGITFTPWGSAWCWKY